MNTPFRTPRTTRLLAVSAVALVSLDMSGAVAPSLAAAVRMGVGLCGIGAVTWFLAALIRFRR